MPRSIIAAKKHHLITMATYCSEEQRKAQQEVRRAYIPPRKNKMTLFFQTHLWLKKLRLINPCGFSLKAALLIGL